MTRVPSLFVSHGSPMFALQPGRLGPLLGALGTQLHDVRAVLVVSPHWQTQGVRVMAAPRPATLHDFGGFARELYELQYPAFGAPAQAAETARLLAEAGFDVTIDPARGYDHGAWVPLRYLLPDADLPVFQVSLPFDLDAAGALRLGAALAPLREQGVLVMGSGSLTHNLYEYRRDVRDPDYAEQFAAWVSEAVLAGNIPSLLDYRRLAPWAVRAHPTEEHYLPLLVALGAAQAEDVPSLIRGGVTDGILSMDSFAWGLAERTRVALAEAA